jgi:hypothetical protein
MTAERLRSFIDICGSIAWRMHVGWYLSVHVVGISVPSLAWRTSLRSSFYARDQSDLPRHNWAVGRRSCAHDCSKSRVSAAWSPGSCKVFGNFKRVPECTVLCVGRCTMWHVLHGTSSLKSSAARYPIHSTPAPLYNAVARPTVLSGEQCSV